jgi:transposase InsO family protein
MRVILTDRIRGIDRIHGELKRLGFHVSRPSIARYLRRYFPEFRRPPQNGVTPKQFLTSIMNAWAIDFFVQLTFFGKPLYVFFIIHQSNREIIHTGLTFHPTGIWVIDQMKRALGKHPAPKYLISDNDPAFKYSLASFLRSSGIKHLRITYRSPWQNGIAERWIQSARKEVFDRIPIFSSRQVEKLLVEYVIYYNHHRTHLALDGDSPCGRPITPKPSPDAKLISIPFADGLALAFRWAA